MDITVVTSITGGKDELIETHKRGKAKFVCFSDKPFESSLWEYRPAYDKFKDPRRNSRIHKLLIHQYIDSEYTIWVDGNIELIDEPEKLVEKYLKDHDIFFFEHEGRKCIYEEALECVRRKLDDPANIREQVVAYEEAGFAKNKGLYIGNFIIRRNTPKVQEFNNAWWSEYCRYSVRDQIALPYAIDRVGMRVNSEFAPWTLASDKHFAQRGDAVRIWPHLIRNIPK